MVFLIHQSLAAWGPILAAPWVLGYVLGLDALKVAGAAIALASGGATGAATIMDGEARHACGEPVVP